MDNINSDAMTVAQLYQDCERSLGFHLSKLKADHGDCDSDMAKLYLDAAKANTRHLNQQLRKVSEEFKEKVKKRHAKRMVVKIEPDAIIDLSIDDKAETMQNGIKRNLTEKHDTQQQPTEFIVQKPRRNRQKPLRFI